MKSKSFKASTWKIYSLCFSFDYLGSIVLHKFPVQVDILVSAGFSSHIEPVQHPPISNHRNINCFKTMCLQIRSISISCSLLCDNILILYNNFVSFSCVIISIIPPFPPISSPFHSLSLYLSIAVFCPVYKIF